MTNNRVRARLLAELAKGRGPSSGAKGWFKNVKTGRTRQLLVDGDAARSARWEPTDHPDVMRSVRSLRVARVVEELEAALDGVDEDVADRAVRAFVAKRKRPRGKAGDQRRRRIRGQR